MRAAARGAPCRRTSHRESNRIDARVAPRVFAAPGGAFPGDGPVANKGRRCSNASPTSTSIMRSSPASRAVVGRNPTVGAVGLKLTRPLLRSPPRSATHATMSAPPDETPKRDGILFGRGFVGRPNVWGKSDPVQPPWWGRKRSVVPRPCPQDAPLTRIRHGGRSSNYGPLPLRRHRPAAGAKIQIRRTEREYYKPRSPPARSPSTGPTPPLFLITRFPPPPPREA